MVYSLFHFSLVFYSSLVTLGQIPFLIASDRNTRKEEKSKKEKEKTHSVRTELFLFFNAPSVHGGLNRN